MTWVVEIKKHVDYFKNQNTDVTTFIAKTEEEAEKLAVLYMMEDLGDNDYAAIERLGSKALNDALISKDFSRMYEALESRLDKLWSGEYVCPRLEVEIYERVNEDFDEASEKDIKALFEDINELMGIDEDDEEGE